jgi:anaerobic ribonucleoside-triphosphate reductase
MLEDIDKQIEEIKAKMNDPKLCDETASTWTRISGYYRAVEFWNNGKQSEMTERVEYTL